MKSVLGINILFGNPSDALGFKVRSMNYYNTI
jgi:hypothetical protein